MTRSPTTSAARGRSLPSHPAAAAASDGPPCHACTALCCRYYALEIDAPEDEDDFESLVWYLLHDKSWIWVDDGDWYLQVDEPCRFLGPDQRCTIYDERPKICREYGMPESLEHPDDPLCDYFASDESHDLEFREPAELRAYARRVLAEAERRRRRRSEAARRGWKTRRARASTGR